MLAEDGGHFDQPERGVAYVVGGRFWVNNHAHILKPVGDIDCGFLNAWLNATDWMPFVGGSTRAKLTQAGLGQPKFGLPPLAEQRRITDKLDAVTVRSARARAELELIPTLAGRYKQALLRSLIPAPEEESRPFAEVVRDGLIGLVRSKLDQHDRNGTPYIRMQHFDLDGVWNDEKLTRVESSASEAARFALREGDVLFNTRNSLELVGKVAICSPEQSGFLYNNNLLRLRFENDVLPRFAFRQMQGPVFRGHLEGQKSATTSVAAIYQGSLYQTPFWVPSMAVQAEIVRRIDRAFTEIDRLTAEAAAALRLLNRLDRAVLVKAFQGELVPQDPAEEPATSLLDRIRAERAAAPKTKRRISSPNPVVRKKSAMPKSRLDDDVKHQPFLASILKASGTALSADSLFRSADLPITDFYKQLAWEIENGLVAERDETLEAA